MRLKTMAVPAILAALALLLGGCPEPGNTIVFWVMPNAENEAHSSWLDEKKAEFLKREGIVVNVEIVSRADSWTRIREALAAGRVPDVIQLRSSWTAAFAATNGLARLNAADFGGEGSFEPAFLGSARYKDEFFAVPWFGETMALVCDAEELAAVKAEAPRTIEELFTVGKKIAARRGRGRAVALPGLNSGRLVDLWSIFLYGEGGRYVNGDGTRAAFAGEEGIRAVGDYVSLYREGLADIAALESGAGGDELLFSRGRSAMCFLTPAGLRRAEKDAPEKKMVAVGTPAEGDSRGAFVLGENLAVPEKSPHKRKAARWISFLLEEGNLVSYTRDLCAALPAKKAVLDGAAFREGAWPVFRSGLARAVPYPPLASWMTIERESSNALKLAILALKAGRYRESIVPDILGRAAGEADKDLVREAEAALK